MIEDKSYAGPYIVQDNPRMVISRRDYFIGVIYSGMISNETNRKLYNYGEMFDQAIMRADYLIKKLNEVKNGI